MARTDRKVGYSPTGKLEDVTPDMAATGVEAAFRMLEGRWKMVSVFHLFDREVLRFSELERAIPGVSQKMLIQQLRDLERDGVVAVGGLEVSGDRKGKVHGHRHGLRTGSAPDLGTY